MFGFDRRIVLEDSDGQKRSACLLETLDEHYFVLLPLEAASRLAALLRLDATAEELVEVMADKVMVMDVRTHRFLDEGERSELLTASGHPMLMAVADRLEPPSDELSAHAFAVELKRRAAW